MSSRFEGINQENIKHSNRSAILKVLNSRGAMSRKDIAQSIGLTPAAVTLICAELMEEGILAEKGELVQEKRAGRKKILVDINYEYRKVLCIQIEVDETHITITNLAGHVYAQECIKTDREAEPESFLVSLADLSVKLIQESGFSTEDILAGGVSVTGIVDRSAGVSRKSFQLWNKPVNVRQILEDRLGIKIVVENNVKARAYGELTYGDGEIRTTSNLMFVKWGPGVGSAITIKHQVYQGRDFRGAEIGHYIVEKNGRPCRCGKKGCLETLISSHAIMRSVEDKINPLDMPKLTEWLNDNGKLSVKNITEWAAIDDIGLQSIIDEKIDRLSQTVENVISVLNPDKVIVYGNMFEVSGVLDRFIGACREYDPELPDGYIIKSSLNDRTDFIGALAIVMDEFFF